jgi:hypothetical protein
MQLPYCLVNVFSFEKWPLTDYVAERFSVCEMRMLRYCLGISLEKHKTNESIRQEANVMSVFDLRRRRRLQCLHVCRREEYDDLRRVHEK